MIRVEGLRAGYRTGFSRRWRDVLKDVSFHVEKGSVTGYLGINGAGKTTTIKVLVGINPVAEGKVSLGGHPSGSQAAHSLLGYFPEAPFFYPGLTARELLDFFGRLAGLDRPTRTRRAEALLDEVGLAAAKDLAVREFSKGMRQRMGLAQALIHEPELLILDEPLDGLDPMGRLHLRQLIARQGERGTTVFFSSHVLSDVEAVCDHLVVLSGGTVAYSGRATELDQRVETTYDLRLADLDDAGLAAVGEAAGSEATRRGDKTVEVLCASQEAADHAVDAARAAGGKVIALIPRRPTLEETFLSLFSEEPAEGTKPGVEVAP